jgi:hypothetical protein
MTRRTLPIVALAGLLCGCQGGPISSYYANSNSLKASVSQLEFRNEALSKQVATLKSENRRYEERLVAEQAENDGLATRLDDANKQLGGRGDVRTGSRSNSGADLDELPPKSRAVKSKSKRQPPAVAIPGRMEPAPQPEGDDVGIWKPTESGRLASRRTDDRWLPVAQGAAGQGTVK